jgi:hypothetical protein
LSPRVLAVERDAELRRWLAPVRLLLDLDPLDLPDGAPLVAMNLLLCAIELAVDWRG